LQNFTLANYGGKRARTAVGKAPRGSLRTTRPDDMAAEVVKAAVDKSNIDADQIEDVILGCAFPEAQQGMNMARVVALRAGLPESVCGQTVNRFCSSGLQTIATASQQIMAGMGDAIVAGGVESISMVPMIGNRFLANPDLAEQYPGLDVTIKLGSGTEVHEQSYRFDKDEGIRRSTSAEGLGKLRPVFHARGSVTAGNSSQTSDGAAAVLVMSEERAEELELKPLARFVTFAVGGVRPEIMGIGPIAAVPKALKLAGMDLADIDLIELNEAFAAQALAVVRSLEMDEEKVNVNGGAIALGHPLGCTGAKLTVQMLHELRRQDKQVGMITMCIGGGMGAAGIIERLN